MTENRGVDALHTAAQAALPKAQIRYQGVTNHGHAFEVKHANETAWLIFEPQTHTLRCNCPSYADTGEPCLHIELLRLWRAAQHGQENHIDTRQQAQRKPPPPAIAHPSNGQLPPGADEAENDAPAAETTEPMAQVIIPWGKFKGQSLQQITATAEGQSYLFFLARKHEARSEADQGLHSAAEQVMLATAEALSRAAEAEPDQAMPILPFGDDKGKPLHQAHPKWISILAKKGDEDARSFQDLVLYRVAKRLQTQRGFTGNRRSNGLQDEQFTQLLAELRGIRTAIEQIATPVS